MITRTPLVAGNVPIKTLVAGRWPTSVYVSCIIAFVPHVRVHAQACVYA
jgi:hypothetical protein